MAEVHIIKNSIQECVIKCYTTESAGKVIDISLENDITAANEVFDANTAVVTIQEIYWGTKKDKQLDISRIVDPVANTIHGHYYLLNAGSYDFNGFVDDTYSNGDIRLTSDGPFHVIMKLRKVSGYTQV